MTKKNQPLREEAMNVYDFDKTIYQGDSTTDFYLYCLRRYPRVWKSVPGLLWYGMLFALGICEKTAFKEKFYRFLRSIPDVSKTVEAFWDKNQAKIKPFYQAQKQSADYIISASPEFLLRPICDRLGVRNLIASRVHPKTGVYDGVNCHGEEKVKRLTAEYPDFKIDKFYSDSLSDTPLAKLADQSIIVKNDTMMPWGQYRPSMTEKLFQIFFDREFMLFLVIGVVNTLNSVIFAAIYSFFFDANLSFILGYVTSLTIAYLLNSKITFRERLSWLKYIKFCISYIPNFIIQNVVVLLVYNILGLHKLIAFALAALIGVPVTFLIMKFFAFAKKKTND